MNKNEKVKKQITFTTIEKHYHVGEYTDKQVAERMKQYPEESREDAMLQCAMTLSENKSHELNDYEVLEVNDITKTKKYIKIIDEETKAKLLNFTSEHSLK